MTKINYVEMLKKQNRKAKETAAKKTAKNFIGKIVYADDEAGGYLAQGKLLSFNGGIAVIEDKSGKKIKIKGEFDPAFNSVDNGKIPYFFDAVEIAAKKK